MRRLSSVRARVEKLTGAFVRDGCAVCREDEARTRFCWRDVLADPPVSVTEVLATQPPSNTCSACGRTYAMAYTVIGWQTRPSLEPPARPSPPVPCVPV